ncbi:O-acetyltransferase OatA [Pedobacter sp. Bi27]|uniref:acyltransferase family protein n=1 Tax=Pedobacter sp. Bi27 TaxID=2822351 RepID=UPI001D96C31D|nr:acyltransferase [Pedobacter sp. Bi27]CAH0167249.1 O-acetyltransferase OatA [Pedobacter sp. Bi27]
MLVKSKERIANIELLRGIASIGVCVVHLQMFSGYTQFPVIDKLINGGQLGVYVFFMVSGFILPYSLYKNNYRLKDFFTFLFKRNLRIDPPYFIVLILSIFILQFENFSIQNFIFNLLYLVPFVKGAYWYDTLFWTLGIEMQFYILLGLVFPLFKQIPPLVTLIILVILFHFVIYIEFGYGRSFIIESLTFFIVGTIMFMVYKRLVNFTLGITILFVLCIEWSFLVAIRYTLISIPTVALVLLFKPFKQKIGFFLGQISYSLYLTHILVAGLTINPLMALGISPFACFIIQISLSILVAKLYYQFIERYFIRCSKKIPYHRDKKSNFGLFQKRTFKRSFFLWRPFFKKA